MVTRQTADSPSTVSMQNCSVLNPLMPEVSAQCTLQETWDLSGRPLLHMFFANKFMLCSVFSTSQCALTQVVFHRWRFN